MAGDDRPAAPPPTSRPDDDELFEALPAGTLVGKYELVATLGQGGFGITYRGRDARLDRDVAIKEYLPTSFARRQDGRNVLPRSTHTAEGFIWGRERFLDEARTLARLENAPGIVNVYDFLEANGTAYMVMGLVQGETLEARLKRSRRLPQPAIEQFLYPLLDGLELVHDAGFLHRDIKPANILLDAEGRPTLIDFGAARITAQGPTQAMTAVFTPGYAAFEQATSGKQGPFTDIYALAATLYHCITGAPPPHAIDRLADDTLVPAIEAGKARYAPSLLAAIDAGLKVRAAERPQTIAQWRQTLSGLSTVQALSPTGAPTRRMEEPVGTERLEPARATLQVRPRGRILAWVLAGIVALSAAGGGAWWVLSEAVRDARRQAEAEVMRKAADEKAAAEAAARRQAEAEAAARKAADEKAAADAARRKAERDAAARKAAEDKAAADAAARRKAEEEVAARRKAEQDAAARKAAEDKAAGDARRKAEEEATTRKAAEEKAAAEAAARRRAEQEAAARKAAEEKAAADAAARRKAEEEAAARKASEEKAAAEMAARRKAEQEAAARKAAEDKAAAEAAARRRAEEEAAARKAAEEKAAADAAARRKAEEEAAARKAAEGKGEPPSVVADSFDGAMRNWMTRRGVATASVAVMHGDRLLHASGYGTRGANDRLPVWGLSKAVTGLCTASLVQEGKLRFDDPIGPVLAPVFAKYGPPADERLARITVAQLLSHYGGLPTRFGDNSFAPGTRQLLAQRPLKDTSADMLLPAIMKLTLATAPGAEHNHSHVGYILLGQVIETLTGRPYEVACGERVLARAGIRNPRLDPRWGRLLQAAGGWSLSGPEFLAFARLMQPQQTALLTPPTHAWLRAMEGKWTDSRRLVAYTLGVQLRRFDNGPPNMFHAGSWHWRQDAAAGGPLNDRAGTWFVLANDGSSWFASYDGLTPEGEAEFANELRDGLSRAARSVLAWPSHDQFPTLGIGPLTPR